MKKDAVICLAAGFSQKQLILKAKNLGLFVAAIDQDKNALCKDIVDIFICKSTHSFEPILEELAFLKYKFNWLGVINRSSGPPVVTASKISEYLGIPGLPVSSSIAIINKHALRERCKSFNIPIPDYKIVSNLTDIDRQDINYPIVIKPSLSMVGKSGITIVSSDKALDEAFSYAKSNTVNGKILIEEYLPGPDISHVSFVEDGNLLPIIVLDEINKEIENGIVTSHGYKVHDRFSKNNFIKESDILSSKLINIFKIQRSPFMACFRANKDGLLKLIEIHLDLGGDLLMEELFPRCLSFDYHELAVKMSIGLSEFNQENYPKPVAIFYNEGTKPLNRRGFKIVEANSHEKLNKKIAKAGL